MKKTGLIFLLLISTYYTIHAQNTFEKVIDTLGNSGALSIQETFDGGYVFCGGSSYNGNDATVVKLDSTGNVEWAKVYTGAGADGAMSIEQLPDSGYMVNGVYNSGLTAKSWLLRLDSNGDTIWTQLYSAGSGATQVILPNSMASINNTIYGLTGYFKTSVPANISPIFIAVQSNGFQLFSKIFNFASNGSDGAAIAKTKDDGFIISSVYGSQSSNDFFLIRINAFGDTLWTSKINYSPIDAGMDIKQTADSGFIVAGYTQNISTLNFNVCLFKTTAYGDTLWTKRIGGNYESGAKSVSLTTDGGYIICGSVAPPGQNYNILLMKTDANGDTLWTRHFSGNPLQNSQGYFVRQTKDGGYIVCGNGCISNNCGSYIIKTDSMGNVASSTGLAELNNPFVFSVYPNPSSGVFTLQVKGFPKSKAAIEVYNLINECVYACNINNNETEQINLSHLPNGIYAVRLRTKNKIAAQKIIIQK